jgi:hypothetical protein
MERRPFFITPSNNKDLGSNALTLDQRNKTIMKGERIMNRLRGKLLQFASFVAALTALFVLVVSVPFAGAAASGKGDPKNFKNAHDYYKIRDPKVDPKLSSHERARVQRDAAFKKRQAQRKLIQDVMSGKQPASSGGGDK